MSDRKPKASSSIWRNRNLNLLWFGEGISVTGSIATTVVLPLAAIAYFDAGPTLLGVMASWRHRSGCHGCSSVCLPEPGSIKPIRGE